MKKDHRKFQILVQLRWSAAAAAAIVIAAAVSCSAAEAEAEGEEAPLVSRIAFGSCANQSAPQPIWNAIIEYDPQVFIWLGDNIYGDIRRPFKLFGKERTIGPWKNVPRFIPSSEQEMKSRYHLAKANPGYSRLRTKTKVVGTWDDHDFGLNDAGKEFPGKINNQRLMLDFLDEPQESPRRKQAGIYASYVFGPVGKQVKVILLDTRYHRDPLFSDGSILGEAQWKWLEEELNGPSTAVTIIGSSIQVITNHSASVGPLFYMESWGRFPSERSHLFKLLSDSKVLISVTGVQLISDLYKREGVFFISGDVHFGEISRSDCAVGYPLYDITSSGLTQAVEKVVPSPLHLFVRFLAWLTPAPMRVMDKSCRFHSCTCGKPNFGTIEIDWNTTPVSLRFEVKDENGLPVTAVNISLLQLQGQRADTKMNTANEKFQRHCSLEVDLPFVVRYRLNILFLFTLIVVVVVIVALLYIITLCSMRWLQKYKLD